MVHRLRVVCLEVRRPWYLAKQSAKAASVLGMDETQSTWLRIATIIHDGLPDLIRMPPAPEPELGAPRGSLTLLEDNKIIAKRTSASSKQRRNMFEFEATPARAGLWRSVFGRDRPICSRRTVSGILRTSDGFSCDAQGASAPAGMVVLRA